MNKINEERKIKTGLKGKLNLDIMESILGQIYDGKWENSIQTHKWGEFIKSIELDENDEVIMRISTEEYVIVGHGRHDHWFDNDYNTMTDNQIKAKWASFIKALINDWKIDWDDKECWKRSNTNKCNYFHRYDGEGIQGIRFCDIYKAYDILLNRNTSKYTYGN